MQKGKRTTKEGEQRKNEINETKRNENWRGVKYLFAMYSSQNNTQANQFQYVVVIFLFTTIFFFFSSFHQLILFCLVYVYAFVCVYVFEWCCVLNFSAVFFSLSEVTHLAIQIDQPCVIYRLNTFILAQKRGIERASERDRMNVRASATDSER